jgi:hypothetical protein
VFAALDESAFTLWLNEILWGFPAAEIFHIVMTGGFFGGILLLDLRLLGWGRKIAVTQVLAHILPKLWLLFGGVVISGSLLFFFMPLEYSGNPAFLLKLLLIPLGGLNALLMHRVLMKEQHNWDVEIATPAAVRVSAAASLAIWIGCLACGRMIAYYYGV